MEQQCISIAKASVSRSIPTKASILAAANPVGGHYNKAKTVAENLKIGSPLLSRFDLIFILLDQPNEVNILPLYEYHSNMNVTVFLALGTWLHCRFFFFDFLIFS